jgi:hypothetical protein
MHEKKGPHIAAPIFTFFAGFETLCLRFAQITPTRGSTRKGNKRSTGAFAFASLRSPQPGALAAKGTNAPLEPLPPLRSGHPSPGLRPQRAVGSTDRGNTLCKLLCWRLVLQGFSWTLVKLSRNRTEFGLRIHR